MFFRKSLEERVENAKKKQLELNELIQEYKPFIASVLQKRTGKYLSYGYDDELTIGMMAFKEAIEGYDKSKGKFLSFAKQVITLRSIDYYRKNKKLKDVIYLQGNYEIENGDIGDVILNRSIEEYEYKNINEMRRLEILEYKKELKEWGIEFVELVKASPKHKRLKKSYKDIAQFIVKDEDILNKIITTRRLPLKEIENSMLINRKKLERGRIYIIALVIVTIGDYELLQEYIE